VFFGCGQARVDQFPDDAALKFGDRHQDVELKLAAYRVLARVDPLAGANQGHAQCHMSTIG
jgi:hypothetical protein